MKSILFIALLCELLFSKILVVNSYSKHDQCGEPQLYGFLYSLYTKRYKDIFLKNIKRAQEIGFKMPKWFIKNYLKDYVW